MQKLAIPPELLSDPERIGSIVSVGKLNSLLEKRQITASGAASLCPDYALHLLETEPLHPITHLQEAQQVLAALDQLWSNHQSTNDLPQSKTLIDRGECLLAGAMTNLKEFIFRESLKEAHPPQKTYKRTH